MEQPSLGGKGDDLAPSDPGFNSRWYPCQSVVVAGRVSGQTCCHVPTKVLPILVGWSEPLNKGVSDVEFT